MGAMTSENSSERSTYQRLQSDLKGMIDNLESGTKLPAEPDLAQKLGVSRATLREAMRIFESQGLLRRKQGLGTFVTKPTKVIETGLEVLESIETLAEKIGLDVSMANLNISNGKATKKEAEKLNLEVGSPIISITRVIQTDQSPAAYLVDVLPESIIDPNRIEDRFTGSVLDMLIQIGKPSLSVSKTEISAIHAQSNVAKALHVQRGDTLLLLSGVLFDIEGKPVDFSYTYLLPGYFRLHLIRKVGSDNY